MLRRLHTDMVDENAGTLLRRGSKRQKVLKFFKTWKQKQSQGRREGSVCSPIPSFRSSFLLSLVILSPYALGQVANGSIPRADSTQG